MIRLPRLSAAALPAALCAAVLLSGCGGGGSDAAGGDAGADPATVVPAGVAAYVAVDLHPTGQEKANVERLSQALFGTSDPGAALATLLEQGSGGRGGIDVERDVKPWLGNTAALAGDVTNGAKGDGLLLAASRDDAKAADALKAAPSLPSQATYRGVSYRRSKDGRDAAVLIDHVVAFGTDAAVRRSIDAAKDDDALADAPRFQAARSKVPANGIAAGYADTGRLLGAAASAAGQGGAGTLLQTLLTGRLDGIAATLIPEPQDLRIEAATAGSGKGLARQIDDDAAVAAVRELPGDAWLGVGLQDVGTVAGQILTGLGQDGGATGGVSVDALLGQLKAVTGIDVRSDVLSWMGPGGLFAIGTQSGRTGLGLIVTTKDPAKTRAIIGKLQGIVPLVLGGPADPITTPAVDAGFTVTPKGSTPPISVAVKGDRFVIALGTAALRAAFAGGPTLGESAGYRAIAPKLSGNLKPSLYLDLATLGDLAAQAPAGQGGQMGEVLRRLTQAAGGGVPQGTGARVSIVIGVRTS